MLIEVEPIKIPPLLTTHQEDLSQKEAKQWLYEYIKSM